VIIIGHKEVEFSPFFWIDKEEDIKKTPPNSVVIFKKEDSNYVELVKHCKQNNIIYANEVKNIKDALIASANGASFLLVSENKFAKKLQKIANDYLFNAKIVSRITNDKELEFFAKLGIDGVIFPEGEIKNG
jgi:hypothetical protein